MSTLVILALAGASELATTGVLETLLEAVNGSRYFRWALLVVALASLIATLSGLLEITVLILEWGGALLITLGFLELVAPELLSQIIEAVPFSLLLV